MSPVKLTPFVDGNKSAEFRWFLIWLSDQIFDPFDFTASLLNSAFRREAFSAPAPALSRSASAPPLQ